MSNTVVPTIYRSVIDDVVAAIRPAFDEFGVSDDVLADLQNRWENKVIASHVAEFNAGQHQPAYPLQHPYPVYVPSPTTKSEPRNSPNPNLLYARHGQYALPVLPGPQLAFPSSMTMSLSSSSSLSSFSSSNFPTSASAQLHRLPQTDGPSGSDDDEAAAPPRSAHPSTLPLASSSSRHTSSASASSSRSAVDSKPNDLDDSDEGENIDEEETTPDIVFCTYDRVTRVKNKWKCVLKDGVIHANGKDYLFQRCGGEFEW
ncbi:transcription factor IIA alpha/beta subunit [Mycena rebaudengoi]|nr:transcription factor IIA alpha/beta subunit [Mycena rebaudengoi]